MDSEHHLLKLPPLSLYIHIPWCIRKCPYCDFNSHAAMNELPEKEYVAALLADLDTDVYAVQQREIQTVFIGGGTPSLLSVQAYQALLEGLKARLVFSPDIEITLEANPGSFEAEKFSGYRTLGINRLSLGIQSFREQHLQKLGRVHDRNQALSAIKEAQMVGFDNINLDIMHGLPDQSLDQALADLETAFSFNPQHISWYQLTIEPNTEFYKRPPQLPHDEILWDIQEAGINALSQQGYQQYEISAYAQAGKEARHNINYWRFGDYLGIGAGAHGKITLLDNQSIVRTQKTRLPKDYLNMDNPSLSLKRNISQEEVGLECLMNGLRLNQGISIYDFESRTGVTVDQLKEPLEKAQALGLLEVDNRVYATEKGRQYLNNLLALFCD